jgi:N-acetylglucosaminyl-diphospho-decaprenol L-rhamnosyltransferase
MSPDPAVDVVILTWNDAAVLARAVASAASQEGVDATVTVVDNGSAPPATVEARPHVRLLRSPTNLGVGGGRNLGVRMGHAPWVCVLDSDASLRPGALRRLVTPLTADETIGLTAPVFTGQRADTSAGRAPTPWRKLRRVLNRTDRYAATPGQGSGTAWDVEFAIGACQVFRRDAFEAVDGIDDSARFGPEDVDFCLRLRRAGWRVVQVAGDTCEHPARRSSRRLFTRRGLAHAAAFARHWWRHRRVVTA